MLDRCREFRVLASHLNFTTAARELAESQSALSRHIDELEGRLGFALLERRPVKLTPAGTRFLEGISQVIDDTDALVADCREVAKLQRRALSVSVILANDDTSLMVYDVLAKLHDRFPAFEHRIEKNRQVTIRQAVVDGLVDVGVIYHDPVDLPSGIVVEHMFDEPFAVWMHEDNPLARRRISFPELSACSVVLSTNRLFTTWVEGMRDACRRYGCTPTFATKDLDALEDFLVSLQRNEVIFISTSLTELGRMNAHLRRADVAEGDALTYPVKLIWRTDNDNSALAEFVSLFREASAARRDAVRGPVAAAGLDAGVAREVTGS